MRGHHPRCFSRDWYSITRSYIQAKINQEKCVWVFKTPAVFTPAKNERRSKMLPLLIKKIRWP